MDRVICVSELMSALVNNNTPPERLVSCATRNLYSLDKQFLQEGRVALANNVRMTIAYVKLLYDYGQQMSLARSYLLHRIKLFEVRELDLTAEMSVLRGISPLIGDTSDKSLMGKECKVNQEDKSEDSDPEMNILMDTRMIKESDLTREALRDISQRLEEKKDALLKIEREMDDVSGSILSTSQQDEVASEQAEHNDVHGSQRSERTHESANSKRPRDEGARNSPSNINDMEMSKEHEEGLPPQEDFGTSRGRPGGAPDATRSVDQELSSWHESCEGTAGVELASAPADQVATGEKRSGKVKEDASQRMTRQMENLPEVVLERRVCTPEKNRKRREEEETTPRTKRKARVSPGVISPAGEELAETKLRRRSERVKKLCVQDAAPVDLTWDTSEEEGKEEDMDKMEYSERDDDSVWVSGEEALPAREEEHTRKEERKSRCGKQAQKAKQKKGVRGKEHGNEEQTDLMREEEDGEGPETEETGRNRQREVGKDRKIQGKKHEEKDEVELNGMMSQELREYAVMLLEDMETVRLKSKNMQGTLSGILKDRINGLRGAIECLLDKLEFSGDVTYYKTKNNELTAENKRLKKEGDKWEQEKRHKDNEIESYREMYEDAESRYVEAEKRIRDKDRKESEALGGSVNIGESVRKKMTRGMESTEGSSTTGMDMDIERTEEEASRSESMEDLRWPAIRPPLRGRSKILTTARQTGNLTKTRSEEVTAVMRSEVDGTPRKTTMRSSEMSTAPEKRKKREISYTEEMERIDKQMRALAEERESLREGKTSRNEKPRIISDVQIAPLREDARKIGRQNELQGEEWTRVAGRRREIERRPDSERTGTGRRDRSRSGNRLRRMRAAVVAIRTEDDSISYADVLRKTRQEISLGDLGIETTRIRRGINGSLLIEVPGQESKEKARVLEEKLKEKFVEGSKVVITRPNATAELRIFGFDESVTTEEVSDAVAVYGSCTTKEVKVGQIRSMFNGLRMVWIRCPLAAARDVAREGRIRIGWTEARVEMLAKRPLQCFRCWSWPCPATVEFGHVRLQCKASVDRKGHCFRCGNQKHTVKACTSTEPRCVVCEEKGNPANHRIGSRFCAIRPNQEGGSGFTGRRRDTRGDDRGEVKRSNEHPGEPRRGEDGNGNGNGGSVLREGKNGLG